jgi:hypothetical protein
LFNRPPESSGKPLYVIELIVCEATDSLYFHHGYPMQFEAWLEAWLEAVREQAQQEAA